MSTVNYPQARGQLPLLALVMFVLVVGLAVVWNLVTGPAATVPAAPAFKGGALENPVALPLLTLRRADGGTFTTADLVGRTSLFYFGYTRCPDVCPLALAQITQARRQAGTAVDPVDAYFVTVDPGRDTPERLREYTANFAGTLGLTGTPDELAAAYAAFGVVAQRREADRPGDYFMDHTAHTFLVDPAGRLRLVYAYPPEPADIAADLRTLAAARTIRVVDPWVRAANRSTTGSAVSAVYFAIENTAGQPDVLLGATSDAADEVDVHRTVVEGGVMRMAPAGEVQIPAGGRLVFAPAGLHVMLTGLRRDLRAGAEIVVTLRFARAGEVAVRAVARG